MTYAVHSSEMPNAFLTITIGVSPEIAFTPQSPISKENAMVSIDRETQLHQEHAIDTWKLNHTWKLNVY